MLEFKEGQYVSGLWFLPSKDKTCDFMGVLYREEGKWKFLYRFRYYNSPDPFDQKDEKNWFRIEVESAKQTEEEMISHLGICIRGLVKTGFSDDDPDFLNIKSDKLDDQMKALQTQGKGFVFMKTMSKEEWEKR